MHETDIQTTLEVSGSQPFEDLSTRIIGAAIEIHSALGPGFLETIYEEDLKLELSEHKLRFESQKEIKVEYLGVVIGTHRLDLIVEGEVIVELKTVKDLADFILHNSALT
jgi:GxxExxY protein